MLKLHLFLNGQYIATTQRYKTAKSWREAILKAGSIKVASIPDKIYNITKNDKISIRREHH